MEKEKLEGLFEHICKTALKIAEDKEVIPILFAVREDSILEIPYQIKDSEQKAEIISQLKGFLKTLIKPIAIITVNEARAWKFEKGQVEELWKERKKEEADDVIIINIFSKEGTRSRVWYLKKKKGKKREFSDMKEFKDTDKKALLDFSDVISETEKKEDLNYIG